MLYDEVLSEADKLVMEVEEKYGEYLEMVEHRSAITSRILAALLIKEREHTKYYKELYKIYSR